jgi:hypothetical protein
MHLALLSFKKNMTRGTWLGPRTKGANFGIASQLLEPIVWEAKHPGVPFKHTIDTLLSLPHPLIVQDSCQKRSPTGCEQQSDIKWLSAVCRPMTGQPPLLNSPVSRVKSKGSGGAPKAGEKHKMKVGII